MKVVYKYSAPVLFGTIEHSMPERATFLKSRWHPTQSASMWFLVNNERDMKFEKRSFVGIPTGGLFESKQHTYIDTYFEAAEVMDYVIHIFETNLRG